MLFLVYTDYNILYKKDNKIYSENGDIKAIYYECIGQSLSISDYKTVYEGTGKLEYRFINSISLENGCSFIVIDVPEVIVNICKMEVASDLDIKLSYIDIDWVKQFVDVDSLVVDIPNHLDALDYDGSLKLIYSNEDDELYRKYTALSNRFIELEASDKETDIIEMITISDNIDSLLDSYRDKYDKKLIDRLQDISSYVFLDDGLYDEDLFDAIFAEYYWNRYFESVDFNIINKVKCEVGQWVEK